MLSPSPVPEECMANYRLIKRFYSPLVYLLFLLCGRLPDASRVIYVENGEMGSARLSNKDNERKGRFAVNISLHNMT